MEIDCANKHKIEASCSGILKKWESEGSWFEACQCKKLIRPNLIKQSQEWWYVPIIPPMQKAWMGGSWSETGWANTGDPI
jgi:hypothetical protein